MDTMTMGHTVPRLRNFGHTVTPNHMDDMWAADEYEAMRHAPWDGGVTLAYTAFTAHLLEQWHTMLGGGIRVSFHDGCRDYASSADMVADVEAGHLWVRHSAGDDIPADHPMAHDAGSDVMVLTAHGVARRALTLNDIFRAVHDVFGHYGHRMDVHYTFGPTGERDAWLRHRQTFPAVALPALWCETRGQASWTNDYADHRDLPLRERPFAAQKAGMPHPRFV